MSDMKNDTLDLLKKYDVAVPRYTSYPTVPYWNFETLDEDKWRRSVIQTFEREQGEISIYVHLPFCENLCTFCACNKRITKNHGVEDPYISSVLKEWAMYRAFLPGTPRIREIHLGGGTPTFFSPDNLLRLIRGLTAGAEIPPDHEFSIEVHPNYTTEEHLEALASVGFNRISLGVQDFDPVVQFVINRPQTFEKTKEVVDWARKHGFSSVNIDLVYGLPRQTLASVEHTIGHIRTLRPDRIAFYSYAHVPWKSKVQRRYTDDDLPKAADKWAMYHRGRAMLLESGFSAIGMDHFALPGDGLFRAAEKGLMHRNFMGYTTTQSKLLIGLGVSSISDSWGGFAQNEKVVEAYQEKINQGLWPVINGHLLNEEDLLLRQRILDLMCRNETLVDWEGMESGLAESARQKLEYFAADGLVEVEGALVRVTEKGALFIRNISSSLDARLWRERATGNLFSKAI
jgi:oxygen-independent coproporphyrinogen III oxidase